MKIEQLQWSVQQGWQSESSKHSAPNAAEVQLVLVFGSSEGLNPDRVQDLAQRYPHAYLMGCSTAGEICGTQVSDDAIVVTAIQFEHTQVQGYHVQLQPNESSLDLGDRLGAQIDIANLKHVFLLSDGLQVNGSELVRGLQQHLPSGVTVTGGLSGDGDRFERTQVLCNGKWAEGKVVAVGLYGDRLVVGYGSLGGWSAFGPERRITEAQGNVLYQLDGQSALDLYKTYLGDHASELPAAGLLFPLSLKSTSDQQPALVRTILSIDETTQSLTFAGDMPEGSVAQLMHASFDHLVDGAMTAAETCLKQHTKQPELAILISCVGRKLLLKQRIEEEVEGVQEILGEETRLTGFYSYGEIAPFAQGTTCELHNQTMTITTLAEV